MDISNQSISAMLGQALAHHQAGRLDEAHRGYSNLLRLQPKHFDAKHLIGVIALQRGRMDEARACITEALAINEKAAPAWNNLGNVHLGVGELEEAVRCFRRASAIDPTGFDALLNEGIALRRLGRLNESIRVLQRAAEMNPRAYPALSNLGAALLESGDAAAAARALKAALALAPGAAEAHANYATALAAEGRAREALTEAAIAVQIDPRSSPALNAHGRALAQLGRFGEARLAFERLVAIDPQSAVAHCNLGGAMRDSGDSRGALGAFRRASELDRNLVEARIAHAQALRDVGRESEARTELKSVLDTFPGSSAALIVSGTLHLEQGEPTAAISAFRAALNSQPRDAHAHYLLGNALMRAGLVQEAQASYQAALECNPTHARARWAAAMALISPAAADDVDTDRGRAAFRVALDQLDSWFESARRETGFEVVGSTQPFYIAYQERNNRELLAKYGSLCVRLIKPWTDKNVRVNVRTHRTSRLSKVGIASADIYDHSVWNAIVKGWASRLDKKQIDLFLFKLGGPEDAQSQLARRYAARYESSRRSLVEWSQCIADSDLDVLIYPAIGMDALTTQLAAQRLARVQAASWGHPDTTGLPTMDYYISAASLEPPSAELNYSEKLVALPNLGVYYERTPVVAKAPDLANLGLPNKVPLILCPGMPFKYAPKYDRIWVEIAKRTRPARLVFFRPHDNELANQLAGRLKTAFELAGLDYRQCVTFVPFLGRPQYYGLMKSSMLLLDSPGFSGFNTAMQAVECGLPYVSMEGAFLRGRLGSGILRQLGMDNLVASDADAYIGLAASLITNRARLDSIREEFGSRAPQVFEDSTPIAALEGFLQNV